MLGTTTRRGGLLVPFMLLLIAAGGASAVLVATTSRAPDTLASAKSRSDARTEAARKLNDPVAADLLLRRVGLTPEVFAAAGVSQEQLDGVLTAMPTIAPVNDRMELLSQATINLNQANERAVRPPVELAPGENPPPTPAQARAVLDAILDQAFSDAAGSLPAERIAQLAAIRVNARKVNVPVYFFVVDRTDAQWLQLRNAVAAKSIADRRGTTLDAASAGIVSQAESEPAVATAKTALSAHAAAFNELWRTRLAPQH
ncbi:MAG: hypothetical protein ACREJO_15815 [Phycisphaerales bacterium]